MNYLLPFIYGLTAFFLFVQAIRVMSKGFFTAEGANSKKSQKPPFVGDRTGQITVHPEILNQDGDITDEDLLTVRFSRDTEPPQSPE